LPAVSESPHATTPKLATLMDTLDSTVWKSASSWGVKVTVTVCGPGELKTVAASGA
jgi:hypothetical protein